MPMLEGEETLTLKLLNEAMLAWVELEYHRKVHSEIGETPLQRFISGPDVARSSPSPEELRLAFTVETTRSLRRSDCTISLDNQRFEIPASFRHLKRISVRYASWDLSHVHLLNRASGEIITRIFPRDLEKNADGKRRILSPGEVEKPAHPAPGIAPLLRHFLAEYSSTGLPMNYLSKTERNS